MLNSALFQKIHEIVTAQPDSFSMNTWEAGPHTRDIGQCGTVRCMAGWAIHLSTEQPLYECRGDSLRVHSSVDALAEELEIDEELGSASAFSPVAAELLGLTPEDAGVVFHMDDEHGLEFISKAAAGDEDGAYAVLSDWEADGGDDW
jgi:hypothetical protein